MNITFRVDSSVAMGTGHAVRCRTLANALRLKGGNVRFVTRGHPGHACEMFASGGFEVSVLPPSNATVSEQSGFAAWVGWTPDEDAKQTIAALGAEPCDWLVVDHYGLDRKWERQLRPHVRGIMVLEDLVGRAHDCDVLLDQNFSDAAEARHKDCAPPECLLLLGPRYALIGPQYVQYRNAAFERRSPDVERVLVFMGGADIGNMTGIALDALGEGRFAHLAVDVVIGVNHPYKDAVHEQARARPNTSVHGLRPHLADLMANADLALGAGGSTTWERMCLGLPSIVVSVAENQVPGCESLARAGLVRYLGPAGEIDAGRMARALAEAISAPEGLCDSGTRGRACVDGIGAARVAEALIRTDEAELRLRPARASDALTYFAWANDPVVRESALDTRLITLATHLGWFEARLKDPDSFLFVLEAGELPVGQVRFQRRGSHAVISYSLDPVVRHRGWAKRLLGLAMEALFSTQSCCLKAVVKQENVASAATFERLGFVELPPCGGLRHFELHPGGPGASSREPHMRVGE